MMELIPVRDMERLAIAIAKSGLFGMKRPEEALALMAISQAEGKHPALAARDYDIIQGRPAKKSEAMLRDFILMGGSVTWHRLDDEMADATFSHPQGGEVRISWDMERAKQAGIGSKDMWRKYPRQMLRARVISEGVRTVCPMATSGMYVPEEVRDFKEDKEERVIIPDAPEMEATVVEEAETLTFEDLREKIATAENLFHLKRRWEKYREDFKRLTPEQQAELRELKDAMKKTFEEGQNERN